MKDVLTLAVFAAKVLCLIVFVFILKPDGSIGAVWTSTNPTDCTEASGKQSRGLAFFPAVRKAASVPALQVRASCTGEIRSADVTSS